MSIGTIRYAFATVLAATMLAFGVAGTATVQAAPRSGRATFGPLTDITKRAGNEAETAVAIQQTNTNHVTVLSNIGSGTSGSGLVHMWSTDGGATWNLGYVATGSNGLPLACCDASLTSDEFGNIFMVYLSNATLASVTAISTDGGVTFQPLHTLATPSSTSTAATRAPRG